ncbi:MAG: alanine racemase [Ilumatobacteraceae bacterium]
MTVRLTVDRSAWRAHVRTAFASYGDGLVPVVKGNGYGFGRPLLHEVVVEHGATTVCVGTVHELHDVPAGLTPVVLSPTLHIAAVPHSTVAGNPPILTVGSCAHLHALAGWQGRVIVKLASSMRRYGATPAELPAVLEAATGAGLALEGFGLHLPLAGDDSTRLAEVEAWLPHLPLHVPLWLSHLRPETFAALRRAHPSRRLHVRIGTALWHGVPRQPFLHLTADVVQSHRVRAGEAAGYFHTIAPHDGTLVAIGAGSAHGIAPLDDADPSRRSPFHFARHRLPLLERPHMHTSLAIVPDGRPCPQVGDRVDVQRPLISTTADEVEWT